MGGKDLVADNKNEYFQHEYGHYLQSQVYGPLYFAKVGIPSLLSKHTTKSPHYYNPVEQDANIRAFRYFKQYYPSNFDTSDAEGTYTGRWYHDSNSIKGMDWKNYGSNTDNNEKVLSLSPLGLAWYDVVLRFTPVLGEIVDGLINMNHYNNTY